MASAACNTIPPVMVDSYTPNGGYIELAGLRTCMYLLIFFTLSHTNPPLDITGSQASTKAIVDVHDIFGLAPQTLQGADLLAAALNALVLVPDFFKGEPIQGAWLAGGEENEKLKATWWAKHVSNSDRSVKELLDVVEEGKKKWKSVSSWGANGLCWGGKVSSSSV